jgi:protein arginine kinase activator
MLAAELRIMERAHGSSHGFLPIGANAGPLPLHLVEPVESLYGTTWCERCGERPAVAEIAASDTGETARLCEACAALWEAAGHSWASGAGDLMAKLARRGERESLLCPRCGFDLEDVVRRGKVGCPECYGAFEAIVSELLAKAMPHPAHSGKRPAAWRNGRPPAPLKGLGLGAEPERVRESGHRTEPGQG